MLWTLRYTYILYIYHRPSHPSFIPIQWSESNLIFSSPSAILPLPSQECSETEDHVTVQISKHLYSVQISRYFRLQMHPSVMVSVCIYVCRCVSKSLYQQLSASVRCIQVFWLVSPSPTSQTSIQTARQTRKMNEDYK